MKGPTHDELSDATDAHEERSGTVQSVGLEGGADLSKSAFVAPEPRRVCLPRIDDSAKRGAGPQPMGVYGMAFVVGFIANVCGMCAAGAVGMFAIVTLPVMSALVSGVATAVCALIGRFAPASPGSSRIAQFVPGVVFVVGLMLYSFGMIGRQPEAMPEPGETYQLGGSYWPGYFLMVLGVTWLPISRIGSERDLQ